MAKRRGRAPVRLHHAQPVVASRLQAGEWGPSGPAAPSPQNLAHLAQTRLLSPLKKIYDRAMIPVVPHRKEYIMTVAFALHHNLVAVSPQHGAAPPAFA